jgi:hypothetical protein
LYKGFLPLREIFLSIANLENGDLLAPRRQERKVRKFNFCDPFDVAQDMLCAFARVSPFLVAARPGWDSGGYETQPE